MDKKEFLHFCRVMIAKGMLSKTNRQFRDRAITKRIF